MKKIFLVFFTSIFGCAAVAQESDTLVKTPTFTEERDSAFAPLDKSRVPFGILYDRVFQFARLDQIKDGDTLTVMHWIQGVSELERACISSL